MNAHYLRSAERDVTDDEIDPGQNWQSLRAVLQREAHRLQLSRHRAILEFEAAGINLSPEV
jgi:hypothetical protein